MWLEELTQLEVPLIAFFPVAIGALYYLGYLLIRNPRPIELPLSPWDISYILNGRKICAQNTTSPLAIPQLDSIIVLEGAQYSVSTVYYYPIEQKLDIHVRYEG